jgi:hypothetical protein
MISHPSNPLWSNRLEAPPGSGGLRHRRRIGIPQCVEFIRRDPDSPSAGKAAARVGRILAKRFPAARFESNMSCGELDRQLLLAVRNGRPLVAAFARRQDAPADSWAWQVHLVEIAGVAARVDELVPTIHTPDQGTFRAAGGALREPLPIDPFGTAIHTWSCRGALWRTSRATLTYVGSYGEKALYLRVRPLTVFLD